MLSAKRPTASHPAFAIQPHAQHQGHRHAGVATQDLHTLVIGRQDYVIRSMDSDSGKELWNVTFGKAALLPVPAEAGLQQLRSRALQMTHEQQLDADGARPCPCNRAILLSYRAIMGQLKGPWLTRPAPMDQERQLRSGGGKPCMQP